ncbi:MAG: ChaN family lipoprotein [Rhizobiaceae bacterium]
MKFRRLILCLALVVACIGSVAWAQSVSVLPQSWQSTHYADHPLVGQVYNAKGKLVPAGQIVRQARLTRYVLLGEQHDNPDHHVIQANIIGALAGERHRPAVVFEMVPQRLAVEISKYDLAKDPQLDDFAKRLQWEERGWYSWDIYRPIALAAARNNLPMVAGNLNRDTTRLISKKGLSALDSDKQTTYGLTTPLSPPLKDQLLEELRDSHCNLLPEKTLPAMVKVQRARDGSLADAMIRASRKFGSILIAGNGHVRKDRAVPMILRQRLPGSQVVSLGQLSGDQGQQSREIKVRIPTSHNLAIAIIEVSPDRRSFADYELTGKSGEAQYDYVIFTPKFDTTDHCAAMREQFEKMKKTKP